MNEKKKVSGILKEDADRVRKIADHVLRHEYESLTLIDTASGRARLLYTENSPFELPDFDDFSYEEATTAYIIQNGYEQNPQEIMRKLSLQAVMEELKSQDTCYVHYYVAGASQTLLHKRAMFFYTNEDRDTICLLIQDVTQSFEDERTRYLEFQRSLEDAKTTAKANNHILQLFNRDMRTPIHSILGLAEIADTEAANPEAIRNYLYKIKSAGSSMSEIIDDILLLSRITQTHSPLHYEPVSLSKTVSQIRSSLEDKLRYKELTLICDIPKTVSDGIITDEHYFNTVLLKLLHFAINNTLRGGEISLAVRELVQKQRRTLMEFTLNSYGTDFNQEQMLHLFRPNEFLIQELKEDLSSIDLNLVILKYYIAALGGSIIAHSGSGTSTSITVSLQFSLQDPQPGFSKTQKELYIPDLHQYCALIVDDDPINLEVGVRLLERTGIRTIAKTNGADALLAVTEAAGDLDVILLDIRMPGMDGLEAARRIRQMKLPRVNKVPIIALTVNSMEEDLKKSMDAGFNAHLSKPIEPADLYQILRKYLNA
ncbi:MAG: response regulator [Blautia sp.]|nr:response regulator [Blautia sp.]